VTGAPKPLANRPAETGGAVGAIAVILTRFFTRNPDTLAAVGAVWALVPAAVTQVRGWMGK